MENNMTDNKIDKNKINHSNDINNDTIQLVQVLEETLSMELYQIMISNPVSKNGTTKIKIRPVLKKDQLLFQSSRFEGTKVFHDNFDKSDMIAQIESNLLHDFRQMEIETMSQRVIVLVSKKGKMTITKKKQNKEAVSVDLSHNRKKKYILEENKPVGFLVDLGVQTPDGKIVRAKYDKFKQINRYLEFIQDILPSLPKDRTVSIIDFGCGKSYLTFAMYYYLKVLHGYDIRVTGLDLKEDVISDCNKLSQKYGYDGLNFLLGDISTYEGATEVDMVVTLHACDTATDHALAKAVKWNAKVIFSVPCCQHEVNKQISCEELQPVLKYGLLRERMSSIFTDAIRANLLEKMGYETQVLEFIDMEHTPKNILIRAILKEKKSLELDLEKDFYQYLGVSPTLYHLLREEENEKDNN